MSYQLYPRYMSYKDIIHIWPKELSTELVNYEYHTYDRATRRNIAFTLTNIVYKLPEDTVKYLMNTEIHICQRGMLIREYLHDYLVETGIII